jgi:hypothetical protein
VKTLAMVAISLFFGAPYAAAQSPAPASTTTNQSTASVSRPPIDPAKAADIQRLIEVAGMRKLLADTMSGMTANIRPTLERNLPPGPYRNQLIDLFFERLQSKLKIQDFIDIATAAYDKYLSDDDIKGLIVFYQTPLGKKTLTTLPQMLVEVQAQGMRLGEVAGRDAMTEVLAEHPDLAKSLQDASATQQQ